MSTENEFGKEIGLIHQAAVTGRSVGADRKFWSVVAHDKSLMKKFVDIVEEYIKPSITDRQLLGNWLDNLMGRECPYLENQSYYAKSSRSSYDQFMTRYHKELAPLFKKAENNYSAEILCEEIEILFVLAYIYSSVYCAIKPPHSDWSHHPWYGLFTTFYDLINGDSQVIPGYRVSLEDFLANKSVIAIKDITVRYAPDSQIDPVKELNPTQANEIFVVCFQALKDQRQKIETLMISMSWTDFQL